MGYAGDVTGAQKRFLKDCAELRVETSEVAKKTPLHKVEAWVDHPEFRKALRRRLKAMRLMREMDIARGAEEAGRRLARAVFGNGDFKKDNLMERRACNEIIQLARFQERAADRERIEKNERLRLKRLTREEDARQLAESEARRKEEESRAWRQGVHPDWSDDEARRLLQELDELNKPPGERPVTGSPQGANSSGH